MCVSHETSLGWGLPPPSPVGFLGKGPAGERCHPERSEGSACCRREILRCAQDDSLWRPARFNTPTSERQAPPLPYYEAPPLAKLLTYRKLCYTSRWGQSMETARLMIICAT